MTNFEKLLEENKETSNKVLEKIIPRDMGELTNSLSVPIWNFIDRGGKRWRPLLAKLCGEATTGCSGKYEELMVIAELIHNGSLIVDDIEDSSELRRNAPCLHILFGIDTALNAANFLYFLPFKIVKESKFPDKARIYGLIGEELIRMHMGQAADISWHKSGQMPTETEYFEMCANKTGSMARLTAKLGAAIAGATEKDTETMGKFAESIGVAFQIQDDILNIKHGLGKDYGEDITEGKKSLPVIMAFATADTEDKARLKELLAMHTKDRKLLDEAIGIIIGNDAVEKAERKADELIEDTLKILDFLPESTAKDNLKELAKFMVKRNR